MEIRNIGSDRNCAQYTTSNSRSAEIGISNMYVGVFLEVGLSTMSYTAQTKEYTNHKQQPLSFKYFER